MTTDPFGRFKEIIAALRNPDGGCPWDLEQTHQTLKPYLIEEAYEALEAIDQGPKQLCEELGDLLLQIFLHSQIASESGNFAVEEVVEGISAKIINRHPHVFGDTKVKSSGEVLQNWEQIKKKEKDGKRGLLEGLPKGLPALQRAKRLGEKTARVGFDWERSDDVKSKIAEELKEFLESAGQHQEEEFGDMLFALSQYARKLGIDPELALHGANSKFTARFTKMEEFSGGKLEKLSREELELLWQEAKRST